MNPFDQLCNEEIHVQSPTGEISGPHRCVITKGKVTIFDDLLHISTEDKFLRSLPNGQAEKYDILDVNFTSKFHQIPGHFDFTVRQQGSLVPFNRSKVTNISISHSHGIQIADHNRQQVVNSFEQ
jgi:hypothetical protein